MGERFSGNWRVLTATLFSAVLIASAYFFAKSVESPSLAQASTETALLQAIATKDSDGDGLPDWEEALYGTDSRTTDSFHLGMTDGEAVARGLVVPKAIADVSVPTSSLATADVARIDGSLPAAPAEGTLTAAFAQNFFALYLAAKQNNGGADLTEADMQSIANDALKSLSAAAMPASDFKSAKDIAVSGSGSDAMKEFAVKAEAILRKNTTDATANEIEYLKRAIIDNDATALPHIIAIAKGYRDSAFGLSMLPVPEELVASDLALVNAMMRVSQAITDFARVDVDPLATMLALQLYPRTVASLGTAFIDIGKAYAAAGISLPAGVPGASFVNLIADLAREQAAQKP